MGSALAFCWATASRELEPWYCHASHQPSTRWFSVSKGQFVEPKHETTNFRSRGFGRWGAARAAPHGVVTRVTVGHARVLCVTPVINHTRSHGKHAKKQKHNEQKTKKNAQDKRTLAWCCRLRKSRTIRDNCSRRRGTQGLALALLEQEPQTAAKQLLKTWSNNDNHNDNDVSAKYLDCKKRREHRSLFPSRSVCALSSVMQQRSRIQTERLTQRNSKLPPCPLVSFTRLRPARDPLSWQRMQQEHGHVKRSTPIFLFILFVVLVFLPRKLGKRCRIKACDHLQGSLHH